ncbi:MAG: DNA-binding protein [Sporomusaceae bacterium]|nr:DNA-binding protein [Sporomusaceae bacterium]
MLSPSLEDYLEEIYRFSVNNNVVRSSDISRKLKVKLPSVTKALRRLRAGGYITYQKYGVIGLTAQGSETGNYLVQRNAILQEFLQTLRADCDFAAEAERMEHYLSKTTIAAITCLLSFLQENPEIYRLFLKKREAELRK